MQASPSGTAAGRAAEAAGQATPGKVESAAKDPCRDLKGYLHCVHPPESTAFEAGHQVYAQLRVGAGCQGWARATVSSVPSERSAADGDYLLQLAGGRVARVARRSSSREAASWSDRLVGVTEDRRVVLVAETADFRRLARCDWLDVHAAAADCCC